MLSLVKIGTSSFKILNMFTSFLTSNSHIRKLPSAAFLQAETWKVLAIQNFNLKKQEMGKAFPFLQKIYDINAAENKANANSFSVWDMISSCYDAAST